MKLNYLFPSIVITDQLTPDQFFSVKNEIESKFNEIDNFIEYGVWGDNVHATHNKCTCIISHLKLNKVEKIIIPYIQEYLSKLTLFKTRKTSLKLDSSWINITTPNGYQNTHIHNSNFISGTLYLDVPKDSGNIEFSPNIHETLFKTTFEIEPCPGLITVFHGMIPHRVKHNKTNLNRISLSFNYQYDLI